MENTENYDGLVMYYEKILSNQFLAIKTAIKESLDSKIEVKAKLGNELIAKLDQVFQLYFHEQEEDFAHSEAIQTYEYLQPLLELKSLDICLAERSQSSDESSEESSEESNEESSEDE